MIRHLHVPRGEEACECCITRRSKLDRPLRQVVGSAYCRQQNQHFIEAKLRLTREGEP